MTLDDCRRFYSEEVKFAANLSSPALIAAFARVPRENFLGPPPWNIGSPEQRALSLLGLGDPGYVSINDPRDLYHNVVVTLDIARNINNGQPSALGRWIDALQLKAGERIFHLGCGVGYYTAILAEVVGPKGSVAAIEFEPDLAARAKENLAAFRNVAVHQGDGALFDPGECDGMLINAGVTHPHSSWLDRLREGGRMVLPFTIPAGSDGMGQGLMFRLTRRREGYTAGMVGPVGIYSCRSVRDTQLEPLLLKALSTRKLFQLKSVRRDAHEPTDTCVVHGSGVCLSSAALTAALSSRES